MKSKVAYLCSSVSWGGLEMNHLRNAKWMQDRGYEVCVIGIENTPFHQRCHEMNLPFQPIDLHKKYYDFSAGKKLASLLKKQQFTHLIIRHTRDMSITANVKFRLKNAIHTSYFMEMQLGVKKTNFLHTLRFKYIDLWSCPLLWLKKQVETMTRFKNELMVIPSGLELLPFSAMPSPSKAREELNLPEKTLLFGLVGRFDPQKGQLLLLEAMQKIKNLPFGIVLLGEPTKNEGMEYTEKIQAIAKQFPEKVFIRPFRKDIRPFYSAVDWFVMATKAETFGMVTIESLAAGTPVLGSNAGGTPEILKNETGGKLFESMNPDDLAQKMKEILSNQQHFDSESLKNMAKTYHHQSVCEKVEKALSLSNNPQKTTL